MTKKCCLIFPHRAFACSVRERRPLARRTARWRGLPCQRVTRFSDGRQPVEVTSLVFGQEREHLIGTRAMCGSEVASLGRLWRGGLAGLASGSPGGRTLRGWGFDRHDWATVADNQKARRREEPESGLEERVG